MQFERSDEASNGAAEEGALLGTAAAVYVVDSPTAREIALLRREGGGRREEDATAVRIQRWTLGVSTLLASILVALAAFVFLRRGGRGAENGSTESNAIEFTAAEHVEIGHALNIAGVADDDVPDGGNAGDDRTEESRSPVRVLTSSPSCPYIAPIEEEAGARGRDPSISGNVVVLEDFNYSRLGNRFVTLSRSLSLGFCCKSKLVSLPPKDDVLAPGIFNEGLSGPRNFDFSRAPGVEGFDAASCPANITWGGTEAFHLSGFRDEEHPYYTPGLFKCVKALPPVIGCEAAYLFPTDTDLCPRQTSDEPAHGDEFAGRERGDGPPGGLRLEWGDDEEGREGTGGDEAAAAGLTGDVTLRVAQGRGEGGEGLGTEGGERGEEGARQEHEQEREVVGNLVMHVRSGDIFVNPAHSAYGQPPLQYYIRAIEDQKWGRVDVVTNGLSDEHHALNPVVPALEAKVAAGELPANIYFHKNRSMAEDLLSMICADGFVAAKSTLRRLVSHHSFASRVYLPLACDEKLTTLENTRPDTKVFGMSSREENYSVYQRRNNTPEQLAEMLTFNVTGFQQCIGDSSYSFALRGGA